MTNNKKLAKTSGTPGKTKLINHFVINELVSGRFAGCSYAKACLNKKRNKNQKLIHGIFEKKTIGQYIRSIDSRHKPQKIDVNFINMLGAKQYHFYCFHKIDKLSERQRKTIYRIINQIFWSRGGKHSPMFESSAKTGEGRKK